MGLLDFLTFTYVIFRGVTYLLALTWICPVYVTNITSSPLNKTLYSVETPSIEPSTEKGVTNGTFSNLWKLRDIQSTTLKNPRGNRRFCASNITKNTVKSRRRILIDNLYTTSVANKNQSIYANRDTGPNITSIHLESDVHQESLTYSTTVNVILVCLAVFILLLTASITALLYVFKGRYAKKPKCDDEYVVWDRQFIVETVNRK